MSNVGDALNLLLQGFKAIGDAITILLQALFSALGWNVPDYAIRLIMLGLLAAVVWRYGKLLPKLLLLVIAFVFASTIVGLLLPTLPL
mgnify:CR=1 FL=1